MGVGQSSHTGIEGHGTAAERTEALRLCHPFRVGIQAGRGSVTVPAGRTTPCDLFRPLALQQRQEGVEPSSVVGAGVELDPSEQNNASICASSCRLLIRSCLSRAFSLLS